MKLVAAAEDGEEEWADVELDEHEQRIYALSEVTSAAAHVINAERELLEAKVHLAKRVAFHEGQAAQAHLPQDTLRALLGVYYPDQL